MLPAFLGPHVHAIRTDACRSQPGLPHPGELASSPPRRSPRTTRSGRASIIKLRGCTRSSRARGRGLRRRTSASSSCSLP
jgi:hypothetical protein